MAVTRKHNLYAVGLGATLLGGITRQSIATGTEVRREATSGEIYARFQSLYAQKIAPGFSTKCVGAALTAAGTLGASFAGMTGGLALYAQKHADGAARTSGSTHRKYGFSRGLLAPKNLTVDHRGDAQLTYDAVIAYDGNNDPLVITDSAALPAGIADAERFTLGPTQIGGVSFTGVHNLSIDFGIDVVGESADSDVWDTFVSIRQVLTTIRLTGLDVEWLKAANVPLAGLIATHANTAIYLRKRLKGSSFVGPAVAEHIKLAASGLAYIETPFEGQGDSSQTTLVLPLDYDGTNAPLAITVGIALPT